MNPELDQQRPYQLPTPEGTQSVARKVPVPISYGLLLSFLFVFTFLFTLLPSHDTYAQKRKGEYKKIYPKVSKRTPKRAKHNERKIKVTPQRRESPNISNAGLFRKRRMRNNYEPRDRGSIGLRVNHNKNYAPRNKHRYVPGQQLRGKPIADYSGNMRLVRANRQKFINNYRKREVFYAGKQIDNRKKRSKYKGDFVWMGENARKRYLAVVRNFEGVIIKKRNKISFKQMAQYEGGAANDYSRKQAYQTGRKKMKKQKLRYDPNESSIWENPNTYQAPSSDEQ